jgi:DNA-binding transcriptional LysR family regulator
MRWEDRIGRRLKLRDMNIFLAVVQWRSMAKAAAALAISQPVVSKAIGDLEHTLGVRLLDRDRRGIEPTPYGLALLNRGLAAFDELRQGVKEIEFLADPTAGEVRVGGTPPMVEGLLPVVISRVYRQHPRLTVRVTQALTGAALYQSLRERDVDFIIGRMLSEEMEKDLAAEVLFHEPLFVVAGRHNPLARRRRIELAELTGEPWVTPYTQSGDGTTVGALIAAIFKACGLDTPQAVVSSHSIEMMFALLASDPFLAMVPGSILQFGAKRPLIKVLPVQLPLPHGPVGIVTLKARTLSPAAQLFIQEIRNTAKSMAGLLKKQRGPTLRMSSGMSTTPAR